MHSVCILSILHCDAKWMPQIPGH